MNYYNKILQDDLKSIYESKLDWTRFHNCTILVTGANGFLPAYLIYFFQYLNKCSSLYNIKILGLVRNEGKAKETFKTIDKDFLEFVVQDIKEPLNIDIPIDFIIHAASQASPKYYGIDPVGTLSANVLGTINLLEFARKNNVKSFLYFSSGDVYGNIPNELLPITETTFGYLDPIDVRSCYAESKRMGENICLSYYKQYGIKTKIVRPFHTYGPGFALNDGRVFADFVSNVVNNTDIILKSDGQARRSFCYISDATTAFLNVLLNGENGEAYNVGNPNEEYSINELANIISKIYPTSKVRYEKRIKNDNYLQSPIKRNIPQIEKINKLNWTPKVSVIEGFKKTINSFL
jgi:UDP-glucuronate decarboxylase